MMAIRSILRLKRRPDPDSSPPWLIVGLGNPGTRYQDSWHNCGFRVLDKLTATSGIRISRVKFKGLYGKGTMAGSDAVLLMPTTFMNKSGESVAEAMRFFHIPADRVIVMYDDLDFPAGDVRIRLSGGPGTHNGMKSVLAHMGTRDFPRIRIGIGPAPTDWDLADYVLSEIPEEQHETMNRAFAKAAEAAQLILSVGVDRAMNQLNAR